MPFTTRVVHLRSFLTPPLQITPRRSPSYGCIQIERCAPRAGPVSIHVAQCRHLHLFKTARARTTLGQHKVLTFSQYDIASPSASQHTVNLVDGRNNMVAEGITLQELYDKHIKPGYMLYFTEMIKKGKAQNFDFLKAEIPSGGTRTFAICKAHSTHAQISKKTTGPTGGLQFGPLKILNFTLSSPPDFVQIQLDRAYRFIETGCPVEFRLRFAGTKLTKAERIQAGDPEVWPWMHDHFPHMRPDFILKSMPAQAYFLISPVTNNRIVQFVVAKKVENMPKADLLTRLFKVKQSVEQSIVEGRQGGLPSIMRNQLKDAGHTAYTERSSLPALRIAHKFGSEMSEEGGLGQEDVSAQRHLIPTSSEGRARWLEKQRLKMEVREAGNHVLKDRGWGERELKPEPELELERLSQAWREKASQERNKA